MAKHNDVGDGVRRTPSAPVLSAMSPTSGPVTRLVTITGNRFSTTPELNKITFNGLTITTLSATAATLTTQVPSGTTTGPVAMTVSGLTSNGMTFTVANAGPPSILTAISPNIGSVQVDQQITLTGTNFVTGTAVKIGNKPVSALTLVSTTTMMVEVLASVLVLLRSLSQIPTATRSSRTAIPYLRRAAEDRRHHANDGRNQCPSPIRWNGQRS